MFFPKVGKLLYINNSIGDGKMTKNITPELSSIYSQEKPHYSSVAKDKYIDKGNLTSRECGRLVKSMIEDYEKNFYDWE
jgi:hypothetical protein